MSNGVEFDNDRLAAMQKMQNLGQQRSSSRFAQWLMDKGIANSDAAAQAILIGIVIVNFIIMFFVMKYFL